MPFARLVSVAVAAGLSAGVLVGVGPQSVAAAHPPKPVVTSIAATYGSSVGYAHLVIRGRHLSGGHVTVAGRGIYAHVISSTVITAFAAAHPRGSVPVVVRTTAGTSNAKRYKYIAARFPDTLRASALAAVPGGTVGGLLYQYTSCPAVGTCVSVGADDNLRDPLLARISRAGRTVTQRVPVPTGYDPKSGDPAIFYALSCPSARFCAAVGGDDVDGGLISSWNGKKWTTRAVPNVSRYTDIGSALTTVSCGSPALCVAFGDSFVDVLAGGKQTVSAPPAPKGYHHAQAARVSCSAATRCTVIGSADVGETSRNFVGVRHGSAWTTRTLSDPPRWNYKFPPDLAGLDCADSAHCTVLAGGQAGGELAPLYFATLHNSATRWTTVPAPADASSPTSLEGDAEDNFALHCPSVSTCWALTAYSVRGLSGRRGHQPVALRLHDGKVRVYALPRPPSSRTGRFDPDDLSCASAGSCVAVGTRGDDDVNNVHGDAIVETFANGVWTPLAAPSPAGRPKYSGYEFTAVSCSAPGRCTAVGDYNYAHNPDAEGDELLEKLRPVVLEISPR